MLFYFDDRMAKTILIILLVFCFCDGYTQQSVIVLKKGQHSIQYFWKDSRITFQLKDKEWMRGIITRITADSFYLTKEIIRYNVMGNDTLHFSGFVFAFEDVYALPTKKELTYYDNDKIRIIPGHENFLWVRNGFIFQVAGAGYVGLNVINDLAHNSPPFAKKNLAKLAIGAAVFLVGRFLHFKFDPYLHIGKKYHLECIVFQEKENDKPPLKSF